MIILRILVLAVLLGGAQLALAQAPPKGEDGFEPVQADMMQKGETIPAANLVAGAYGFIFASVLVYTLSVASRARRIESEVAELRRRVEGRLKN